MTALGEAGTVTGTTRSVLLAIFLVNGLIAGPCLLLIPSAAGAQTKRPRSKPVQAEEKDQAGKAAALFESGQTAHQSGDLNKAVEFYRDALKLDPTLWQAEFQLSIAKFALNQPADAKASMLRVIEQLKQFTPSQELNHISARANTILGEIELFEGKLDEAQASFLRAIGLNPQAGKAHAGLAETFLRTGKTVEGIAAAKAAIDAGDDRASTFAMLGGAYLLSGKSDEALTYLDEALRREPGNAIALRNRAEVFAGRGDLKRAIEDLRAVLKVEPVAGLQLRLAGLLARSKQFDEALALYRQVLRTDPTNNEAQTAVAALMIESGQGVEAIAQLESLVKAEPNRADLRAQLADLYLQSQTERALEHYQVAAKLEPGKVNHQIGVGSALVKMRRFQEAIDVLKQALAHNPQPEIAYFAHTNLATSLFELDDFPNAAREFIWILNYQQKQGNQKRAAVTLYFLGICFDKLGDYEQALKAYDQFLNLASSENQLEIDKVKLRMPSLQRQIKEGKGKRKGK